MHLIDDDGAPLDAQCTLDTEHETIVATFESASGRNGTRPPKNPHYNKALTLLLGRLQRLDATLIDALVDSLETRRRGLSEDARRISQGDPVVLRLCRDMDEVRRELTRNAAWVGQSPTATREGNRTKRIKLIFALPQPTTSPRMLARYLATGASLPVAQGKPPTRARIGDSSSTTKTSHWRAASAGRAGGIRQLDADKRTVIEQHAVDQAIAHYEGLGYKTEILGKPYDIRAVKGNEEVHVEVKGSTLEAEAVELTINEVRHADTTETHLFVVDMIGCRRLNDGTYLTDGGRPRLWTSWRPEPGNLTPTRFSYQLPTGETLLQNEEGLD